MRNLLKEAALVVMALLITGSMAYAMQSPKATTVEAQTATEHVEPVKTAPEAPKAVEATPTPQTAPEAVEQPVAKPVPTTGVEIMAAAGVSESDYAAVDYIVSNESGWCATKSEGEIGYCPAYHGYSQVGYGLCQSTPANKMASAGSDWATNPVTQMRWCSSYAQSRYGGWQGAYQHWISQKAKIGHGNW